MLKTLEGDIDATVEDPAANDKLEAPTKYEEVFGTLEPRERKFFCLIQKRHDVIHKAFKDTPSLPPPEQDEYVNRLFELQIELDMLLQIFWIGVAERVAKTTHPNIWTQLQSQMPLVRKGWCITMYDTEKQMTEQVMTFVQRQQDEDLGDMPDAPSPPKNKRQLN